MTDINAANHEKLECPTSQSRFQLLPDCKWLLSPVVSFSRSPCRTHLLSSHVSCWVLVSFIVSTCVLFVSVYLGSCFVSSLCLYMTLRPVSVTLSVSRFSIVSSFHALNPFFDNVCVLPCIWVLPHHAPWQYVYADVTLQMGTRYFLTGHYNDNKC